MIKALIITDEPKTWLGNDSNTFTGYSYVNV